MSLARGLDYKRFDDIRCHLLPGKPAYIVLGHFWSLCVEEQYYLIWPLIVLLVRSRVRLMQVCIAGMTAVLILRVGLHFALPANWLETQLIYKSTPTRLDTLLAGSALALWGRRPGGLANLPVMPVYVAAATCLGVFLSSAVLLHTTAQADVAAPWLSTYGYSLLAVVMTALTVASLRTRSLAKALTWSPLVWCGKISYGIYILHMLPVGFSAAFPKVHHLGLVFFALTLLAAHLSFKYFESPFLRLKDRWAPQSDDSASGARDLYKPNLPSHGVLVLDDSR